MPIVFKTTYLKLFRRQTIDYTSSGTPEARHIIKLEDHIRASLDRANAVIDMMHLEICILPVSCRIHPGTIYSER